jgi:HKD family nuclease
MWSTEAEPGLNADVPLSTRLADALEGADELLAAVAYVKRSGSEILAAAGLPSTTRFVVGIGFGLTDPEAVEDLAELGADVRVVVGAEGLRASAFHPKLDIVRREGHLTVFSGSANLTSGGLESNVEQYERLRMSVASPQAKAHTRRFDTLWRMGVDLAELCDIGAWADYAELARRRRERVRRDAAEEASVDARMRARLRERHGESLGGRRGDAGAVADRLHALLEEATGIAPEARRRAYVRMDNAIGVRSFQRVGLELWGADLVLAVWPGELQGQARQLYESERAAALVELIETNVRWQAIPSPHLAFPNSPPRTTSLSQPNGGDRPICASVVRGRHGARPQLFRGPAPRRTLAMAPTTRLRVSSRCGRATALRAQPRRVANSLASGYPGLAALVPRYRRRTRCTSRPCSGN